MPRFFIERPIFAWVVALLIASAAPGHSSLAGGAVSDHRAAFDIRQHQLSRRLAENLYNSVTRLIEEEFNGANGILNFESTSDSLGQVEITANFVPGTNTETASVEVQNRIKRVEARLPRAVIQQGILIEEASSAVLQIIALNRRTEAR